MVRALVRLNLIRLLHSSMLWVPLGASMALAFLWSNVLHVDALNTHAPANGWDLLLMLQNNGKILAFALVVPFSLWTGDLVAVDRERGYRAQLCLRTAHQAPWAYPLALVASVVLGAALAAVMVALVWLAMGGLMLGAIGPHWSPFARAGSVYWPLGQAVLRSTPPAAAASSLMWNILALLTIACVGLAIGQSMRVRFASIIATTLVALASLAMATPGTPTLQWSPLGAGVWLLHAAQHTVNIASLPAGWPGYFLAGLIALSVAGIILHHQREGSW